MARTVRVETTDAPESRQTPYSLAVGERFEGTIAGNDTGDWIAVRLEAGKSYVMTAGGRNGASAGLNDTVLNIHDANGKALAGNDDVGGNNSFSLIEFTAPRTGLYYLDVAGFGGSRGDYYVQVAPDTFTVDDVVSQMTEFGWGFATPLHFDVAPGGTITVNIANLREDGQRLALWALEAWSAVSGLNFRVSTAPDAMILFDDNQVGAFAGPGSFDPATGVINQSTVNIGVGWLSTYGTTIDSYSYQTYLHEIGHALGLYHSGNYNGTATYGVDNHFVNDTSQLTVMSYFTPAQIGASSGTPLTPMVADVAAIWELYGTPRTINGGNTVWGAGSNVGGTLGLVMRSIYDGATAPAGVFGATPRPMTMTITDTGGRDTLDLSTATVAQVVDLAPGSHSNVFGRVGNLSLGHTTVIENAVGGSGRDEISGNGVANVLSGNRGNDRLEGRGGRDVLIGGAGDDLLRGDADSDILFGGDIVTTGGPESGQIFRLYQAALGRVPDAGGHAGWTAALITGEFTLDEIAARFIAQGEFQGTYAGVGNTEFITLMYRNVLGRAPDPAGLAVWVARLESGSHSRPEVVLGFSESAELVARSAPALERFETAHTQTAWSDEVFRIYQAALGRAPDLAGFEDWTGQLAGGLTMLDMVSRFLGSAEFQRVYGAAAGSADFVTLLYHNVLGRAPDPAGLAGWVARLDTEGVSRAEVVLRFSQSAEFVNKSSAGLKDFMIAQSGGPGQDDTLQGGTGTNDLYGGLMSDTFVFDAALDGVNIVQDFEPWDVLRFQGFGYTSDAQVRARMVQEGEDVVFRDQGVTVRLEDVTLAEVTDDLIFF